MNQLNEMPNFSPSVVLDAHNYSSFLFEQWLWLGLLAFFFVLALGIKKEEKPRLRKVFMSVGLLCCLPFFGYLYVLFVLKDDLVSAFRIYIMSIIIGVVTAASWKLCFLPALNFIKNLCKK